MSETHTCPRRLSAFGPWERAEGLDRWVTDRGMAAQVGPSCDFCGSLHPDRFMELVREGWIVGPTDKSYKAYLAQPYTDAEVADRKQRWLSAPYGVANAVRELGAQDGKTPEQINADLEHHWDEHEAPLLVGGNERAKFYYEHLSAEQRDEFIDLHNSSSMRFGYPGYLYVLPYFT